MKTNDFNPTVFVNTVSSIFKIGKNVLRQSGLKNIIHQSTRLCGHDVEDVYYFLQIILDDINPDWMNLPDCHGYHRICKVFMNDHSSHIDLLKSRLDGINLKKANSSVIARNILFKTMKDCGVNLETLVTDIAIDHIGWEYVVEAIIKMSLGLLPIPTSDEVVERIGKVNTDFTTYTDEELSSFRNGDIPTTGTVKKTSSRKSSKKKVKKGTVSLPKEIETARTTKPSGTKTRNADKRKPVVRYTLDGVYVDEFESVQQAADETKSGRNKISTHLNHIDQQRSVVSRLDHKRYIYKYKTETMAA